MLEIDLDHIKPYLQNVGQYWPSKLPYVTFLINTTVHATHKKSPYQIVFKHSPSLFSDLVPSILNTSKTFLELEKEAEEMRQIAKQELDDAHKKQNDKANEKRVEIAFKPGDIVKLQTPRNKPGTPTKLQPFFSGPYVIVQRMSRNVYKIRLHKPNNTGRNPRTRLVSASHLHYFHERDADFLVSDDENIDA